MGRRVCFAAATSINATLACVPLGNEGAHAFKRIVPCITCLINVASSTQVWQTTPILTAQLASHEVKLSRAD